ncbi:MAG TPA: hypothetical protein VGK57_03945, partial [Candidatus Binatia bacterium]
VKRKPRPNLLDEQAVSWWRIPYRCSHTDDGTHPSLVLIRCATRSILPRYADASVWVMVIRSAR